MSDFNAETYRQREAHWRHEAARYPIGAERNACEALANGYAHLVAIIGQLNSPIITRIRVFQVSEGMWSGR